MTNVNIPSSSTTTTYFQIHGCLEVYLQFAESLRISTPKTHNSNQRKRFKHWGIFEQTTTNTTYTTLTTKTQNKRKHVKFSNRTHSEGNVPKKTITQHSHNHHNKVIYEYKNRRHAQEHNRETLKTTKHIKITRSQKKTHKKNNQQTQTNKKQQLHGMNSKHGTTHYTKNNTQRHKEETEHIRKIHTSIIQERAA